MLSDSQPIRSRVRSFKRAYGVSFLTLLVALMAVSAFPGFASLSAQTNSRQEMRSNRGSSRVNYPLAARFAPYKMQELVYSTSVTPDTKFREQKRYRKLSL